MMRPEDREKQLADARQERYEWAKSVDPEAVEAYEDHVHEELTAYYLRRYSYRELQELLA
jgi:hypothetical protein